MKRVPPLPATPPELLQTLAPLERLHYRAAWRFNQEPFKRFMALFQYTLGSIFIRSVTARRTRVSGCFASETGLVTNRRVDGVKD